MTNSEELYKIFYDVIVATKGKALSQPETFVSVLFDISRGKIENWDLLKIVLRETVINSFKEMDTINQRSIDNTSEMLCRELYNKHHVSEEWATAIAYSMGAAIKKYNEIPFDETVIFPQTKEAEKKENPITSQEVPGKPTDSKKRKKGIFIAASCALLLLVLVILILDARSTQDRLPDMTPEEYINITVNTAADYQNIIDQYRRLEDINYDMDRYYELLKSDYSDYCYITYCAMDKNNLGKANEDLCYAKIDINQDGILELIIAATDGTIYDIFTESESGAVSLFGKFYGDDDPNSIITTPKEGYTYDTGLGYRQVATIDKEGHIFHFVFAGMTNCFFEYTLPEKATELHLVHGTQSEDQKYRELLENGEVEVCSDKKYVLLRDEMMEYTDKESNLMNIHYKLIGQD